MEGIPEGRQATFREQPSQSSRPPMRPPAPPLPGTLPVRPEGHRVGRRRLGPMIPDRHGSYPDGACKWYYQGRQCKRMAEGRECSFAHVRPDDFGR